MTSQELQKQALQLPISDRWQLVQTLLESLKWESQLSVKRGNLSSLRGIAKSSAGMDEIEAKDDYVNSAILIMTFDLPKPSNSERRHRLFRDRYCGYSQ